MKISKHVLFPIALFILPALLKAQTNKDIQGTWQMFSTVITMPNSTFNMDSSQQYLVKTITAHRIIFSIYDKKADSLLVTGQGAALCDGNKYIEKFEHATSAQLKRQPMVFTYKVEGNKLTYEGGAKDFHIVENLVRIE